MNFDKDSQIGFNRDERALANNIAIFFATLVMGFLLYIVVEPAGAEMLDAAALHTERESSQQGQDYLSYAWQSAHIIVIGFGVLQLLVAAIVEARLP